MPADSPTDSLFSSKFTAKERLESLKAAAVSGAAAGAIAAALLLYRQSQGVGVAAAIAALTTGGIGSLSVWLSAAIAGLSGALFGLTYRYAVGRSQYGQLQAGVVLAFGLVRGLALVDVGSALAQQGWPFAAAVAESLLLFGASAAALNLCLQNRWIQPFSSD
jgi:hypothetical protein